MRLFIVLLLVVGSTHAQQTKHEWTPTRAEWEAVRSEGKGVNMNRPNGTGFHIPQEILNNLLTATGKIEAASGMSVEIAVYEHEHANAFARVWKEKNWLAVSALYLWHFGKDADAVATTIGHEMAHLHLGHTGEAREAREGASLALGIAANLVIPFSGLIVSAIARGFTRDEERAADEQGLKWAIEAGYDPCGKARVADTLAKLRGQNLSILSTHPSYAERSELADAYSRKANNRPCPAGQL